MTEILCIDCKHYKNRCCESPKNKISVIDGKPSSIFPESNRAPKYVFETFEKCGPEAKFFEQKIEEIPKLSWWKRLL